MDPKRPANLKLLARICGYLREIALICGFEEKSLSGLALATRVMGRGGYSAYNEYQNLPVIPLNSG
jgi:hypothetical protein